MWKEVIMTDQKKMSSEDVIDLGAVSTETKGSGDRVIDSATSLQPLAGLSDD